MPDKKMNDIFLPDIFLSLSAGATLGIGIRSIRHSSFENSFSVTSASPQRLIVRNPDDPQEPKCAYFEFC